MSPLGVYARLAVSDLYTSADQGGGQGADGRVCEGMGTGKGSTLRGTRPGSGIISEVGFHPGWTWPPRMCRRVWLRGVQKRCDTVGTAGGPSPPMSVRDSLASLFSDLPKSSFRTKTAAGIASLMFGDLEDFLKPDVCHAALKEEAKPWFHRVHTNALVRVHVLHL